MEGDQWDWDFNNPNQYCHHGSFIGSWWGPDILCPQCENGEEPTLQEMIQNFDTEIEKQEKYLNYCKEIITYSLELIDKDNSGYAFLNDFSAPMAELIKSYQDKISSLLFKKENFFQEYSEFCNDFENDRNVLYKRHAKRKIDWEDAVSNYNNK